MRTTSAPRSARTIAQKGPGPMPATSITRTPSSGPIGRRELARRGDASRALGAGVDGVDGPHQRGTELTLGAGDVAVVERVDHRARDGRRHLELLPGGDGAVALCHEHGGGHLDLA